MSNPNSSTGDLTNVFFYYTCVAEAKQKYQTEDPKEKEYTVTVVLDKKQYTDFVTQFPKKKTTPVENSDFEEQYKTKPPFPDQPLQYVLKFKQKTHKANGDPMPESLRPRVYQFVDKEQKDITDTLIGNGSKGTLRWNSFKSDKTPNPTVTLYCMLITELVSYERPASGFNHSFNPQ